MLAVFPLGGSGLLHKIDSALLLVFMKHSLSCTQNQCVTAQLRVCGADFFCDKAIKKHNPTLKPVMHTPDKVWETNCLMIKEYREKDKEKLQR